MALDLSEFKPLTLENYTEFYQGLSSMTCGRLIRYYESPLRLMHQPHVFKLGYIDDELVVLKDRQIMGTQVLYAILPSSYDVVSKLNDAGIPSLIDYGYSSDKCVFDNEEYIYNLRAFSDRYGVNKNQLRKPCNKAESLIDSDAIDIQVHWGNTPYKTLESCNALTGRWLKQRDKKSWKSNFFIDSFNAYSQLEDALLLTIMEGDKCIGYHLSHRTDNGLIYDTACKDYDNKLIKNMTPVLLHYASKAWEEKIGHNNIDVNRGAAVRGAASKIAKQKLRPSVVNKIYKTIPAMKMTKELKASYFEKRNYTEWL